MWLCGDVTGMWVVVVAGGYVGGVETTLNLSYISNVDEE